LHGDERDLEGVGDQEHTGGRMGGTGCSAS
jgi:hypothetical protein